MDDLLSLISTFSSICLEFSSFKVAIIEYPYWDDLKELKKNTVRMKIYT